MRYLVFFALAGAAFAQPERDLARSIFKEFVEIHSGYSTGATTPVAEAAAKRLRAAGFPAGDIFVGGPIPTKHNLVVRLRGTGARRPILLLAHSDVVEARREDWSMDPFTFIEKDGYFYGRGTGDDKAQAAIWIANLVLYKQQGFRPDRDIIVALTADEEGGGPYSGVQWLLKNHRDLIDAEFALNEGGYGELVNGKRVSNDVQVAEKSSVNFHLEVRNSGGHSSMPVADNAIYHLAGALDRLGKFGFPLKTNEVTRAYFAAIAPGQQDLARLAASPAWNAMLRTTCVATQVEAGHARNALPQLAAANVNCRILPEDSVDYVLATLKKVIADDKVAVTVDGEATKALASPLRDDILRAAKRATDSIWPGVPVVPMMVPYATDGKYLGQGGIPTYGIQGLFQDRDDIRWHGRDERLLVQSFYDGQKFLYELVKDLSTAAR